MWKKLRQDSGQAMSEYLILVVMIAVGAIAATGQVKNQVQTKLKEISKKFQQDVTFGDN